jgi:crotonobetainyl-CoA:carnitine CoA-transferase CaiB-like acyl-CoA transferase
MQKGALSGVRVLEFGNLVSAPYCGKLMADLGAEVIKVEEPKTGDEARRRAPFANDIPGTERSGLFSYLNTNKLSLTLDTGTDTGKRMFKELAKQTDILVENRPPKLMKDLGFGYEALEKNNPMLVMTSITPFGQNGPYRDYKAYELNHYNSGGAGFISTITIEEQVMPPVKAGARLAQFMAGAEGAVAGMCALIAREQIGGQHVDVSIQECLAGQIESKILHWTFRKEVMGGRTNPFMMPLTPLPCKDGWVFLQCVEERQFENLVEIMGNPDWAKEPIFKDRFTRARFKDALVILLSEWSEQYTKEEILKIGRAGRVPIAPAYSAADIFNSEHLKERDYFVEIDHPEIGKAKYPGAPYRFSETPWEIKKRAPLLGEHNEEILCNRLGCSREDLVRMAQAGVI